MYDAPADPYCYAGSPVLKNLPGHTSQTALRRLEAISTGRRFLEPMPFGRFGVRHFKAVHRHIFQDVYAWAGRTRSIRIAKGKSMVCYPEHIETELRRTFIKLEAASFLRDLTVDDFASVPLIWRPN